MKKGERLMKIIGDADDKFVDEAAQKQKKRGFKIWVAGGGLCAAALAGVMAFNGVFGSPQNVSDVVSGITSEAKTVEAIVPPETADVPVETEAEDNTPPQPFEPFDEPNPYDTDARRASNGLISEITATDTEGGCVKTNTSFLIKSTRDVETDELEKRLSLPEGKEFELTKLSECKYQLSPREILEEGEVVKLGALGKYGDVLDSWAFQTTETFKVKSCYPEDGSRDVYADTGIEIEFSTPPSAENIEDYFEINPPVKTKFTTHRNKLYVIFPPDALQNGTAYTVTLKKGLKAQYSGELTEDYSFSFRTSQRSRDSYIFTYNGFSETFIKGDNIVIEIMQSNDLRYNNKVTVDLYRYKDSDGYYNDMRAYAENGVQEADLSGLDLVYSNTDYAIRNTEDHLPSFLLLPDDLDDGWYIADISCAGLNCRYMLEINPISVYSLALGEENVFFVNDANTGKAAEGAQISLLLDGKTYTGTADKDGICNIETDGGNSKYGVVDIKYGGSRYIDVYSTTSDYEIIYDDLYYMYLYTDREAYLPSDTINVWGAVIPRRDGAVIPSEMYIGFGESDTEGERVKVTPDARGTFRTSFSYKNHTTTYSCIYLYDGTNDMSVMHRKYLCITEYVKPTYVITPELPDYAIMPQRVAVPVGVDVSFYEGTPAAGISLEMSSENTQSIVTDSSGHASTTLLDSGSEYWRCLRMGIQTTVTGVEAEYTSIYRYIPAFYRDVMCNAEYDKDAHTLSVELNSMDFSKVDEFLRKNNDSLYWYDESDYDILKGAPYDTEVNVTVQRSWNEKIQTGSYYDYIEKRTVTTYDYKHKEEVFGRYTVNTENGKVLLEGLVFDKEGNYSITITYKDSKGGLTKEELYNVKYEYRPYYDMNHVYYALDYNDEGVTFYYETFYREFDEITDMRFTLKGMNAEPSDNGRIFIASHQNDFFDLSVYDETEFSYKPPLSALPSFKMTGAYFDGRHIYPISTMGFTFDPTERGAELTITPDKSQYDAGDEVNITVNVKDTQGNPLPDASVILSLVDEAAFAIMDQHVTLLDDLYATIYYPHAQSSCSYIQHVYGLSYDGGGKGGGGDEPSARRDFRDNAFFDRGMTDESGTARFSFKLPDNLTTWRATALAVQEAETGRLYAGNSTCPVVATRPLFITPIMLKEYVAGDDIAFSAKCVGLDEGGVVNCRVTGKDTDVTLSAKPCETVNFGKLPLGEYKALFTAENGDNSDAIEMPFTVVDSVLEVPVRKSFDLSEGIDISPKKYPVTMAFYDKEYMFCTDILEKLSAYYGDRLDMRAAAAYADTKLGFRSEDTLAEQFAMETSSGFARLTHISDTDPVLTAKLAAALPETISRSTVIGYCEEILNSDSEYGDDISSCYLILAALGEPVLEDVKAALEDGSIFDWYDRMRFVMALALCGDYNTAYAHYLELVPEIEHGESEYGEYAYIEDSEQSQELTAAAMAAASLLKLKEADMFARWLYNETPKYDSFALELVVYVENYVPKTDGDAVFTYNLNGELKTVKLDRHHPTIMSFGERQLKNASFKVTSGEVYTKVNFIGNPGDNDTEPAVTVTKTVSGGTKPGDIVYVTIKVSGADKYYRVDDVIPSCGRYTEDSNTDYYVSDVNGQKVTLYINPYTYQVARYAFRITTEGDYVLEGAVAQSENSWGMSERTGFTTTG